MLSSIGHDASIFEAVIIQRLSYRLDLSVYHRRGTNHVNPFLSVAHGDTRQPLQCPVVVNLSVSHCPAVAVASVLAHADVRHDDNISAQFALQLTDSLLNNPVCNICGRADLVLYSRNSEQDH